jgi:hypothetical protein
MNAIVKQTEDAKEQQDVTPTCKLKTRLVEPTAGLCQCLGKCRTAWYGFLETNRNIGLADDCTPTTNKLSFVG